MKIFNLINIQVQFILRIRCWSMRTLKVKMLELNIVNITVIGIFLIYQSNCYDDFRFSREMNCDNVNKNGHCLNWMETTTLYRYSSLLYYCFPADSYVLAREGPKKMKYLKINDEIFSYNLQTGKNQFVSIDAWLHYDRQSLLKYSLIEIKDLSWKFAGSKLHNVAYQNQSSIDFKFLKELTQNDSMVSITSTDKKFIVSSVAQQIEKSGLFSPFTASGTFYIFPESFNSSIYQIDNEYYPMILVHCLSQIHNPKINTKIANAFIQLVKTIIGSYQPQQDEDYVNPLLSKFNFLFGNDWIEVSGQKIAHRYSSYSSYGSSSSYSASNRREEVKKKTMAIVALETILSNTVW